MPITLATTVSPETVVLTVNGRLDAAGGLCRRRYERAEAQAPPAVVVGC